MRDATPTSPKTFVGFGFGAIQAGLYLYEAMRSGAFDRLVVVYRRPETIRRIRAADGYFSLNIAHADGVEAVRVGPVEMFDVNAPADREHIVQAVAEASELATALSSVNDYVTSRPASIHRLLAEGLKRKVEQGGPRALVYTSENHTEAAELLEKAVSAELADKERAAVARSSCFVNTVIGKMSRVVEAADELKTLALEPITPGGTRAFLVEAYRHILVSSVSFQEGASFESGFDFDEKADLTPFEEAKLYGHNATHALAAYLGVFAGAVYMADLKDVPGFLPFLRAAALDESGAALLRRHGGSDPMFTPEGYTNFMENLLGRMLNSYLKDTVARVGRDARRKLGWNDRLIGAMRLILDMGLEPRRHALGVAAALASENMRREDLLELWRGEDTNEAERCEVLTLVETGFEHFNAWRTAGCPPLEPFFKTFYGGKNDA
ncbi:hypothetical protein BH24DEI2_BH24DEI2_05110 [soil metagenome]